MPFSLLGIWHPTLAWLSLPQAPKPHAKSLPLPLPLCGTGTPYLPLSGATSLCQASILSCLCGCLPRATRALTSSSRPSWASALLTLLALWYALLGAHPSPTLCGRIPTLQGAPHRPWVGLFRKKERQEGRKEGGKEAIHALLMWDNQFTFLFSVSLS